MRSELALGTPGVKMAIPSGWEAIQDAPRSGVFRDEASGLIWQIRSLPWRLDLDPANEEALAADVEAFSRGLFEEEFARTAASGARTPMTPAAPRTSDPEWSPVVSRERIELGGGVALRIVRRVSYTPGNETIVGSLLVPVAGGIVEINAAAKAQTTGARESAVMLMKSEKGKPPAFFPQSVYDDPALDASFAGHPLSRLRAALAAREPEITVTDPVTATAAAGPQAIPSARCTVTLPPRFLPLSPGTAGMSSTLVMCTRVALGGDGLRLFDVWRFGDEAPHDAAALAALAESVTRGWEREGAKIAAVESAPQEPAGAWMRARCYARISVAGNETHGVQWWLAKPGAVYRLSSSGPTFLPRETLDAETAAAAATLTPT